MVECLFRDEETLYTFGGNWVDVLSSLIKQVKLTEKRLFFKRQDRNPGFCGKRDIYLSFEDEIDTVWTVILFENLLILHEHPGHYPSHQEKSVLILEILQKTRKGGQDEVRGLAEYELLLRRI